MWICNHALKLTMRLMANTLLWWSTFQISTIFIQISAQTLNNGTPPFFWNMLKGTTQGILFSVYAYLDEYGNQDSKCLNSGTLKKYGNCTILYYFITIVRTQSMFAYLSPAHRRVRIPPSPQGLRCPASDTPAQWHPGQPENINITSIFTMKAYHHHSCW